MPSDRFGRLARASSSAALSLTTLPIYLISLDNDELETVLAGLVDVQANIQVSIRANIRTDIRTGVLCQHSLPTFSSQHCLPIGGRGRKFEVDRRSGNTKSLINFQKQTNEFDEFKARKNPKESNERFPLRSNCLIIGAHTPGLTQISNLGFAKCYLPIFLNKLRGAASHSESKPIG